MTEKWQDYCDNTKARRSQRRGAATSLPRAQAPERKHSPREEMVEERRRRPVLHGEQDASSLHSLQDEPPLSYEAQPNARHEQRAEPCAPAAQRPSYDALPDARHEQRSEPRSQPAQHTRPSYDASLDARHEQRSEPRSQPAQHTRPSVSTRGASPRRAAMDEGGFTLPIAHADGCWSGGGSHDRDEVQEATDGFSGLDALRLGEGWCDWEASDRSFEHGLDLLDLQRPSTHSHRGGPADESELDLLDLQRLSTPSRHGGPADASEHLQASEWGALPMMPLSPARGGRDWEWQQLEEENMRETTLLHSITEERYECEERMVREADMRGTTPMHTIAEERYECGERMVREADMLGTTPMHTIAEERYECGERMEDELQRCIEDDSVGVVCLGSTGLYMPHRSSSW